MAGGTRGVIQFDQYEENRKYLGFTETELDLILLTLEKHLPNDEITKRIDALAMVFRKNKVKRMK